MMTLENIRDHSVIKRLAAIPLFLLLAAGISFSQERKSPESVVETDSIAGSANDWWKPILERHGIVASGYNNFENVFEMGSSNSIKNGVVTLKDAIFLIRERENLYTIIKSPLATHDLESNTIRGGEAILEGYDTEYGTEPKTILEIVGFEYQIYTNEEGNKDHKVSISNGKVVKAHIVKSGR